MRLKTRKWQQKINFDKQATYTSLRVLKPNENVLMRNNNKWSPATVEDQHESPRSYILKDNTGRKFHRNRKHIRPTKTQIQDTEPSEPMTHEIPPTFKLTREVQDQQSRKTADTKADIPKGATTRSGRVIMQPLRFKDYV